MTAPLRWWQWRPPEAWTCLRCMWVVLTVEASPRCPQCGFQEGT